MTESCHCIAASYLVPFAIIPLNVAHQTIVYGIHQSAKVNMIQIPMILPISPIWSAFAEDLGLFSPQRIGDQLVDEPLLTRNAMHHSPS